MSDSNKARLYYKNVDSLRFFAALLVFSSHLEFLKDRAGLPTFITTPFFAHAGHLGVVCFFVLSGFLITSLLLREKNLFKRIDIPKFYVRRILRIWPLYFLTLLLGFFIIPNMSAGDTATKQFYPPVQLLLSVALMPNIAHLIFSAIPYIGQIWSIGVEEQFYLFWPFVVKKARLLNWMFFFLIFFWIAKFFLIILSGIVPWRLINSLVMFLHISSYDSLVIGGIGGFLAYQHKELLRIIFGKRFQFSFYILILILIITGFYFPYINTQAYSLLFAILILNLAVNPASIVSLENPVLGYLGKTSYGIYMFHQIGIALCIKVVKFFKIESGFILWILALCFTLLMAVVSYELFEKKFLKLKEQFSFISSERSKN